MMYHIYLLAQVDLPTIIESQKTIDRKTFYKTADICQLLICKEGEPSEDEEDPPEKVRRIMVIASVTRTKYPGFKSPPIC
jgi:TATA-binding protein-associated factor Taf7